MGLDFDTLYPNKFMKAGEFGGKEFTLRIASVQQEEIEGDKGKELKVVISFEKTKKKWLANKTNGVCLRQMFGRDALAWVGKRVTLFPAQITDPFTGEDILAIRVRGSPDIDADMNFQTRLGRKTVSLKLKKTGPTKAAAPAPVSPPPAESTEEDEAPFGEPPAEVALPGDPGYAP